MAEYAIEIENLSFTYRNAQEKALDNISLKVRKGEILGIIGPTGAGKTTLCRCITGIIPEVYGGRLEGKILVQGRDVRQCNIAQLAGMVGYVQQDAESQLLMTDIEKEIVFPLENLGLPREEIGRRLERALKLVRLEPYRYRHPFYLSGGQK
ncbi:MAG: ABC transporter ATP-binding protein, partial [Moorellaceae bacterium]